MAWILDVVFVFILIGGIFLGIHRGFVAGICKIAGTVLAVFLAVTFCNAFQKSLEDWFGLTTALYHAIGNEKAAYWIAIVISFIALVIIIKLCAWLLGKLFTSIINKVSAFNFINRLLGGLLGLLEAAVAVFLILTFCKYLIEWCNLQAMDNFISSSTIVGAIFHWDWFEEAATFSWMK